MLRFNFLTHGDHMKEKIIVPANIELVKFTYRGRDLYLNEVKALFQLIHKKNRLGADNIDAYKGKDLRLNPLEENAHIANPSNITLSVLKGGDSVTNIRSGLFGTYSEFLGFYNSEEARISGNKPRIGISGFNKDVTDKFIKTVLGGDVNRPHTMYDVLKFLARTYPDKTVRLFFFSCQSGERGDTPMAEGNIENIGAMTPNAYIPPGIDIVFLYDAAGNLIGKGKQYRANVKKPLRRITVRRGKGATVTTARASGQMSSRTRTRSLAKVKAAEEARKNASVARFTRSAKRASSAKAARSYARYASYRKKKLAELKKIEEHPKVANELLDWPDY